MVCWGNVQTQLISCPIDGYLDFFPTFCSLNSAAKHSCVCLLMNMYIRFSVTFLGVELLNQCSTSNDNASLFSKGVLPVYISTQK